MIWVVVGAAVWAVLAIVLAFGIGRAVRNRDRQPDQPVVCVRDADVDES